MYPFSDDETILGCAVLQLDALLNNPDWTVAEGPCGIILERKDGEVCFRIPLIPSLLEKSVDD